MVLPDDAIEEEWDVCARAQTSTDTIGPRSPGRHAENSFGISARFETSSFMPGVAPAGIVIVNDRPPGVCAFICMPGSAPSGTRTEI